MTVNTSLTKMNAARPCKVSLSKTLSGRLEVQPCLSHDFKKSRMKSLVVLVDTT